LSALSASEGAVAVSASPCAASAASSGREPPSDPFTPISLSCDSFVDH
jgi:hypothetical protein